MFDVLITAVPHHSAYVTLYKAGTDEAVADPRRGFPRQSKAGLIERKFPTRQAAEDYVLTTFPFDMINDIYTQE